MLYPQETNYSKKNLCSTLKVLIVGILREEESMLRIASSKSKELPKKKITIFLYRDMNATISLALCHTTINVTHHSQCNPNFSYNSSMIGQQFYFSKN